MGGEPTRRRSRGPVIAFFSGAGAVAPCADRHGYFATELCPPGWRVLRPEAGCAILSIIARTFDSLCSGAMARKDGYLQSGKQGGCRVMSS